MDKVSAANVSMPQVGAGRFHFGIALQSIFPGRVSHICFRALKVCSPAVFLFLLNTGSYAEERLLSVLQDEDCGKCHKLQEKTIHESGGKHSSQVGCLYCHPQHPPEGTNTAAACGLCHDGRPHYRTEDCLQCHADPHKPLSSLRDPVKPAREVCLTCHAGVGQQMSAATSRHAALFCTRCHSRHGFIPGCLDCHQPHLSPQTEGDCLRCHQAHSPLQVTPAGWVPAAFCQICHPKEGRDLADTGTSHGLINCVFCHQGQHPSTPVCQECHGLPHDQSLHSQFRKCLTDCHGDAHRLLSSR